MVDIRERVAEDRGLLKRIQLLIPGFAGYRRKEDLRQADSILRIQIANRLKEARLRLEGHRTTLADNYELKAIEPLGRAILEAQELEGLIRHAEQGYSGFSFAIQVKENELDRLYEFDLSLLEGIQSLDARIAAIAEPGKALPSVKECIGILEQVRLTFKRRIAAITGTEVA